MQRGVWPLLYRLIRALAAAGAIMSTPALVFGQEKFVLGPRQFEEDKTQDGAVLCIWGFWLETEALAKACGAPRLPVDDALDRAIAAADVFILANSSLHPTREALEEFKRNAAARAVGIARKIGFDKACLGIRMGPIRNQTTPEQVKQQQDKLLSVPREPVMNPCF